MENLNKIKLLKEHSKEIKKTVIYHHYKRPKVKINY